MPRYSKGLGLTEAVIEIDEQPKGLIEHRLCPSPLPPHVMHYAKVTESVGLTEPVTEIGK